MPNDPKSKKKKYAGVSDTAGWKDQNKLIRESAIKRSPGYNAASPTGSGGTFAPTGLTLRGADRKVMKAAKSLVRRGTGSGASRSARKTYK